MSRLPRDVVRQLNATTNLIWAAKPSGFIGHASTSTLRDRLEDELSKLGIQATLADDGRYATVLLSASDAERYLDARTETRGL